MDGNVVSNLCSLPATDLNFTSELNRATAYQIKQAIETMKQNGGKNKGRIKACDRELENRRLTKKDKHGKYVSKEHLSILCNTFSSEHRLKAILNKLGEYEDAERQGRLIKLPCKVGDVVYVVTSPFNVFDDIEYDENMKDEVYESYVSSITFYECGEQYRIYAKVTNHFIGAYFRECDFGKTVFLTKSEAEAKLKELRGGKNGKIS